MRDLVIGNFGGESPSTGAPKTISNEGADRCFGVFRMPVDGEGMVHPGSNTWERVDKSSVEIENDAVHGGRIKSKDSKFKIQVRFLITNN